MLEFTSFAYNSGMVTESESCEPSNKWSSRPMIQDEALLLSINETSTSTEVKVNYKCIKIQQEGLKSPLMYSTTGDNKKHNRRSCYVRCGEALFGEIEYFLAYPSTNKENIFAAVHLFPAPAINKEIMVYYCRLEQTRKVLLPLEELSKPLFVAFEDGCIFFLNVPLYGVEPEWLNAHIQSE